MGNDPLRALSARFGGALRKQQKYADESYLALQNQVTVAFVTALSERRKDGGRRPPLQQDCHYIW